MPYLMDLHTHSDSSPDGSVAVSTLCEGAIDAGLSVLAVTDHCECDRYLEEHYDRSIRQSIFEAVKARSVFENHLEVLIGVELGQPHHAPGCASKVLSLPYLDFVIGSLHNLRGKPDFAFLDYDEENADALLTAYFDELWELAHWGKFDVLGHITYPLRYMCAEGQTPPDLTPYAPAIDAIFDTLIRGGKGIEINTSTLHQPLGQAMPGLPLIKRFRERGGEIVTVGSDAHIRAHVGRDIAAALSMARAAGFDRVALFRRREPVFTGILDTPSAH